VNSHGTTTTALARPFSREPSASAGR